MIDLIPIGDEPVVPRAQRPARRRPQNNGKILAEIAQGAALAALLFGQLAPMYPGVKTLAVLAGIAGTIYRAATYWLDGKALKLP